MFPLVLGLSESVWPTFYNLAIFFIFVGSVYIIRVPFDILFVDREYGISVASSLLWILVLFISTFQFFYPAKPFVESSGKFIIWNPHPLAAALTTWGLIAVALTFALTFLIGAFRTKDRLVRVRSIFFASGAVALAIAAIYYSAKEATEVIISMVFVIGGLIFLVSGLVVRMFKTTSFSTDKHGT